MFIYTIGSVHCVNEKGKTSHVLSADSLVQKLLFMEKGDVLLVITENLLLSLHKITPEGEAEELMKVRVRLQVKVAILNLFWEFFIIISLSHKWTSFFVFQILPWWANIRSYKSEIESCYWTWKDDFHLYFVFVCFFFFFYFDPILISLLLI